MPRPSTRHLPLRSLEEEINERIPLIQNKLACVASLSNLLINQQFFLHLCQVIRAGHTSSNTHGRIRHLLLFLAQARRSMNSYRNVLLMLLGHWMRQTAITEILDVCEAMQLLVHTRYLETRWPRCRFNIRNAWFDQVFWEGGDSFVVLAQMSLTVFKKLVRMIEGSILFQNDSRNNQAPVPWQLLVMLANVGACGNGSSYGRCAPLFNISEGSVENYTNRCIEVLLEIEDNFVFWPDEDEQAQLKQEIAEESFFEDCVGCVDGTLIPLELAPVANKEDYWTRKFYYAFNIMLVCDLHRWIRYYELGWCGSAHDQRVFRSSQLFINPDQYFSTDEYILADSAYTPTSHVIPALKRPRLGQLKREER